MQRKTTARSKPHRSHADTFSYTRGDPSVTPDRVRDLVRQVWTELQDPSSGTYQLATAHDIVVSRIPKDPDEAVHIALKGAPFDPTTLILIATTIGLEAAKLATKALWTYVVQARLDAVLGEGALVPESGPAPRARPTKKPTRHRHGKLAKTRRPPKRR
jgi:hypothetical protein